MKKQIIETWHIHNRVHLMLIDAISDEGLLCTFVKARRWNAGKTVYSFTHGDETEHARRVNEWAENAWDAYFIYHNLAKEWIETAKQKFITKPLR